MVTEILKNKNLYYLLFVVLLIDSLLHDTTAFAEIDGPQERLTPKRNYDTSYWWKQITVLFVLGV